MELAMALFTSGLGGILISLFFSAWRNYVSSSTMELVLIVVQIISCMAWGAYCALIAEV